MKKNIFYSWQSDIQGNRNFIDKCIRKAIDELNGIDKYDMYVIERDTNGNSGSPDIKETVFSKIDKSDFFVADVTIINSESEGKKTPNPNVLIELGYAAKQLGWERIICILNDKYGKVDDLPFDIRSHRITCYSSEKEKKEIEKSIKSAIVNTVNIVKKKIGYERNTYLKIFRSDNIIEIVEEKFKEILTRKEFEKRFPYIKNNYSMEFIEYDYDEIIGDKVHFLFIIKIIDDCYSYEEYTNQDCSVFFEFTEIFKQINFKDNRVYSAFDLSPGYSPSGKYRDYECLMRNILNEL